MRITLEEKKKQYRIIYELIYNDPRIYINKISSILKTDRSTAGRRTHEAFNDKYVLHPQVRKKSYKNTREYVYILKSNDPIQDYLDYIEDENIVYHAELLGSTNFWIISRTEIDLKGDILAEGARSDYYVAYAPNHSWLTAIEKMNTMIEKFNPDKYVNKGYIHSHLNEYLEWDSEFEILYREFKYNARKKQTPVRKKYLISGSKLQDWYNKFFEYCTVFTRWFPEGFSAYDPYLIMFETDFEDFIIELFSELPTSSVFFKVGDILFLYANVPRQYVRSIDPFTSVNRLHIPYMVRILKKEEIIKEQSRFGVEYSWGKDL